LDRRGVRLRATGELDRLPQPVREALDQTIDRLAANDGLIVNLAIAYGGRQEIVHAAQRLAAQASAGEIAPEEVTESVFRRELYSPDLPDPDLVIRTSGEARLSNFLLWQSAYSELFITPVLWPDFSERDFLLALYDYQCRERRFGALPQSADEGASGGDGNILDAARWKRLLKVRP
jgi:undecaprenyl diphosphate synthase